MFQLKDIDVSIESYRYNFELKLSASNHALLKYLEMVTVRFVNSIIIPTFAEEMSVVFIRNLKKI